MQILPEMLEMLDIHYDTRRRAAGDPRDKLYALLGIAIKMGIPEMRPHTRSLSRRSSLTSKGSSWALTTYNLIVKGRSRISAKGKNTAHRKLTDFLIAFEHSNGSSRGRWPSHDQYHVWRT